MYQAFLIYPLPSCHSLLTHARFLLAFLLPALFPHNILGYVYCHPNSRSYFLSVTSTTFFFFLKTSLSTFLPDLYFASFLLFCHLVCCFRAICNHPSTAPYAPSGQILFPFLVASLLYWNNLQVKPYKEMNNKKMVDLFLTWKEKYFYAWYIIWSTYHLWCIPYPKMA